MKPTWNGLLRIALALSCALTLLASWAHVRGWQATRDELVALLLEAGFERREHGVIDRVEHERTAHHARLLAARALVYAVLSAQAESAAVPATLNGAEPEAEQRLRWGSAEWEAAVARLPLAAEQARRALAVDPASWEGAMLLGAAVYLERSIRRDHRLYTESGAWEAPLATALERAPGQPEPRRFLAAAYLEVWRALSPAKKVTARRLLTEAFANDPQAFSSLVSTWLEVASSLDEAFSILPDRPSAWGRVMEIQAEQRRWKALLRAHDHLQETLLEHCREQIEEARLRLRLGDLFHGRSLLLQAISSMPLETRFAPFATRALELYPAGLHGLRSREALVRWLHFALELDTIGRNPLPAHVIGRLASAAQATEPSTAAHAAIAAGELLNAESLERQADSLESEAWGPYLIAKARFLLDRRRWDAAAAALQLTGKEVRESVPFLLVTRDLARSRGQLAALAEAEQKLNALRRRSWSATAWRFRDRRTMLTLLPSGSAPGLAVTLHDVPASGAVVELYWDGARVAVEIVETDGEIILQIPVDPEPHLLELTVLAGGRLLPGGARLL